MEVPQKRRAVSPIVATLLLIAISVAAGVIVYVFTSGLAGSLTNTHVNQLTEQVSLDAYNFQSSPPNYLTMYLRNTGTGAITVSAVYFNGALTSWYGTCGATSGPSTVTSGTSTLTTVAATTASTTAESAQGTCQLNIYGLTASAGTSYQVTIVTVDGGKFVYNVVAGQTG